ncbi:hypothetical protein LXL04_032929 [Taraxacum kok-saghyz]
MKCSKPNFKIHRRSKVSSSSSSSFSFSVYTAPTHRELHRRRVSYMHLGCLRDLAKSIGTKGLVVGQVVDIATMGGKDLRMEQLEFIHFHNTMTILELVFVLGVILGGVKN